VVAQSYLEAWADALNAPLRDALCQSTDQLLDRWLTVGVTALSGNLFPYYFQDLLWPNGCGVIPPQDVVQPSGGQCSGVLYRVDIAGYRPDGTIAFNVPFRNVVGPIAGVGTEWTPNFFGELFATSVVFAPNDTEPPTPGQRKFGAWGPVDNEQRARTVITNINREDGLPDNCTALPPGPPPPPPPPAGIPLPPFNFNFGPLNVAINGTVNVGPVFFAPILARFILPVTVNIAPNFVFPGGARFPVNINLPDFNINVPISFFPIDIEVLRNPTVNCQPSEPEFDERVIGVNVTCNLGVPSRVSLIAGNNTGSDLLVPWAAVVRFIPPSFVSTRESVDVPVKSESQFVPCPFPYGADDYTIIANAGVTVSHSPVSAMVARNYKAG